MLEQFGLTLKVLSSNYVLQRLIKPLSDSHLQCRQRLIVTIYRLSAITFFYLSFFVHFSIFGCRGISNAAKSNSDALTAHHMPFAPPCIAMRRLTPDCIPHHDNAVSSHRLCRLASTQYHASLDPRPSPQRIPSSTWHSLPRLLPRTTCHGRSNSAAVNRGTPR